MPEQEAKSKYRLLSCSWSDDEQNDFACNMRKFHGIQKRVVMLDEVHFE